MEALGKLTITMFQEKSQEVLQKDVTNNEEIVIEMKSLIPDKEWSTSLYESLEDLNGYEEQDKAGCKDMFLKVFCYVIILIVVIGGFVGAIVCYCILQIEDLPLNDEELKLQYYVAGTLE